MLDAYDLETAGYDVVNVKDGVPTVPEAGEGVVPADEEAELGDYSPTEVSDGEEVELVGGELAPASAQPSGRFCSTKSTC